MTVPVVTGNGQVGPDVVMETRRLLLLEAMVDQFNSDSDEVAERKNWLVKSETVFITMQPLMYGISSFPKKNIKSKSKSIFNQIQQHQLDSHVAMLSQLMDPVSDGENSIIHRLVRSLLLLMSRLVLCQPKRTAQ